MKLYNKLIWIGIMGVSLTACDYLDFDESTNKTKEEIFSTWEGAFRAVNAVYSFLPQDFGAIGGAMRDAATDNATYVWNNNPVYKVYANTWSPTNLVDDVWKDMYKGIQAANTYLETYNEDFFKRFEQDPTYQDEITKFRMYPYEVRALRAFYYFELAKRYGDVPLIIASIPWEDANTVQKTSFHEVIDFVVAECSAVAASLPEDQNDFFRETGRVTKGMALALKSRALLYAASQLHNPSMDKERWEKAARAAKEVIDMGRYSLPLIDEDPLYDTEGAHVVLTSKQVIFERRNGNDYSYEQRNLPIGFQGGNSGNTPTQNLVDAYEMSNGELFSWDNAEHRKNIYTNEIGEPTRDPRLYKTIVYNGSSLMGQTVESLQGGKNGLPLTGATVTGYYTRKYINENTVLDPELPQVMKAHHFIIFRYAEILLNYAEAMKEWVGEDELPDNADEEIPFTLTARQALNEVRKAAGMPDVTVTGDAFTERLRNERRVELAFEDHRFWDIRRWMIGGVVKDIYGVSYSSVDGYSRTKVQTRIWDNKMYLYPIPQQENYKNPALGQNPGW